MQQNKVFIINPYLSSLLGHSYEYNLGLAKILQGLFDKITIVCEKEFNHSFKIKNVDTLPFFDNNLKKQKLRWRLSKFYYLKKIIRFLLNCFCINLVYKNLHNQIINLLTKKIFSSKDKITIIFDNIPTQLFCYVVITLHSYKLLDKFEICAILLYDLEPGLYRLCKQTASIIDKHGNITLLTDTSKLSSIYSKSFNTHIKCIPQIFDFDFKYEKFKKQKNEFYISYLGVATHTKGFTLLPTILKNVLLDINLKFKLKFLIQATTLTEDRHLNDSIKELKILQKSLPDNIEIFESPLDHKHFKNILINSDLLFMLHDIKHYKNASSGIKAQAEFYNIPIITHYKSPFSKNAIVYQNTRNIAKIIMQYFDNYIPIERKKLEESKKQYKDKIRNAFIGALKK